MADVHSSTATGVKSAYYPTYDIVFDGRDSDMVVEVTCPQAPHAKMLKTEVADIGNYLQFGLIIGQGAGGKQVFMNYFVHGDGAVDVKRLVGKKITGHPVVIKKTFPDGRQYLHVDVHVAPIKNRPTHTIVAKGKAPADGWWQHHYGRQPKSATDHLFELPAPGAGLLALMQGAPISR